MQEESLVEYLFSRDFVPPISKPPNLNLETKTEELVANGGLQKFLGVLSLCVSTNFNVTAAVKL